MLHRTLLLLTLAFLMSCATQPQEVLAPPVPSPPARIPPMGQLPNHVQPISYALAFDIDPRDETFQGHTKIDVELTSRQDYLWLHGESLNVHTAYLHLENGKRIQAVYKEREDSGLAELSFPERVGPGPATIELAYTAPFDRELKGLYKVITNEGTINEESYAFTQFEATSARFAFPSFDEPRFKTPFHIEIAVAPEHRVVTTTPEYKREVRPDGKVVINFEKTKPLPTYLIAIAVGPLEIVEADPIPRTTVRPYPLPFRGVAVKGKGQELAYALQETPAILEAMEDYFGRPYPFKKLDIIAVPDFASGAMENVGAIKFREWLLLLDPKTASLKQKKRFFLVMAHELAHMWFGNLVTMPWWDDIWLNEAFATWMAYKLIHQEYPELEVDIDFLRRVQSAARTDHLASARQIRQPVTNEHDIRNAFDSITYSKGGGMLAMFESWLGKDVFRDGIRAYLNTHAFGGATAEDLVTALSKVSGKDVSGPFFSFLEQPGIPQVNMSLSCQETPTLHIQQSRFLPLGSGAPAVGLWQIPVCFQALIDNKWEPSCVLVDQETMTHPLGESCPTAILPNRKSAGYFHWTMPDPLMQELTKYLPSKANDSQNRSLHPLDGLGIADSLVAGFQSGALSPEATLTSMKTLATHSHPAIARRPITFFSKVKDHFLAPQQKESFRTWGKTLYARHQREHGLWPKENDSASHQELRLAVLSFLFKVLDDPEIAETLAPFGMHFAVKPPSEKAAESANTNIEAEKRPPAPDANWAHLALGAAVQNGDQTFFDGVLNAFHQSTDAVFRTQVLKGLALVTIPQFAAAYRQLSLDPRIRTNEVLTVLYGAFEQKENRPDAWAFLQEHRGLLASRLPTTRKGRLPKVTGELCTHEHAKEVDTFFSPYVAQWQGGPRNLSLTTEKIQLCATLTEKNRDGVQAFFSGSDN